MKIIKDQKLSSDVGNLKDQMKVLSIMKKSIFKGSILLIPDNISISPSKAIIKPVPVRRMGANRSCGIFLTRDNPGFIIRLF
jgi:hypothetical protein